MNKEKAEKLFVDIAKQYETYEDMIDKVRSMNSDGTITDEEYDYLSVNWDNLLEKHNIN